MGWEDGLQFSNNLKIEVDLNLEVKNGKSNFFVDHTLAYQIDHLTLSTKIKRIVFCFQGRGGTIV